MELIICIGIQATGKSEFCKQKLYKTHIRLNLDMLRTRNREKLLLEACIAAKQPVVIDNTNPTIAERQKYITIAKDAGFNVIGYYFQSSINEALAYNQKRDTAVPNAALFATHKKLELPSYNEGFDSLHYVKKDTNGGFIVEDYNHEI